MAVADVELGAIPTLGGRAHDRIGLYGLFALLGAFTLTTLDGSDVPVRVVSVFFFVLAAAYLSFPFTQRLYLSVPAACLLLMAAFGLCQTLWFPQKIAFNGWSGVLFWFTAAVIAVLATQVFQDPPAAARFRLGFVFFASAVCLLDLLERASHASSYYWLIPSKYHAVFGPFSYWNNFAQFVELSLPVTLWQGLGQRKISLRRSSSLAFLLLASVQIGAVVASGSRAGTALVIVELFAVVILAYIRHRNNKFLIGAALAILLSFVFIYAAGFDTVIGKLQQSDQLAVRRDINQSSLAMIGARPLTGWGLDTYVPVYRMFARYDDGTFVNRAHNDWLQWAAEGGLFFMALMLVVFVWSVRPALRTGWGIGLIAICLHALVDYPFARFGVCGWYFALAGMLAAVPKKTRISSNL